MTTPEFEKAALAAMARIPGASKLAVQVTPSLLTAKCHIGGNDYELSFSYRTDEQRELAFKHTLHGIESTRFKVEDGEIR